MTSEDSVPVFQAYMNPILAVLRGESAGLEISDLDTRVAAAMAIPAPVLAVPHGSTGQSEVGYRMAWARSYLKKAGFIDNPSRGVWKVNSKGSEAGQIDAVAVASEVAQSARAAKSESDDEEGPLAFEEAVERTTDPTADHRVHQELLRQIRTVHAELVAEGAFLAPEEVQQHLLRFRRKFGPEILAGMDGEALLGAMHGRQESKDSLAYWLEFKNDDEHPNRFGSISGGSALKFGIYQAAETGNWMAGPARHQEQLTIARAVDIARSQRDQLVAGVGVLNGFADSRDRDYRTLQSEMERVAPDLSGTAWGHKYFYLLFPDILVPFHSIEYQRLQLYKVLTQPGAGHFENERVFVELAHELGLSPLDLAVTLNRRTGGVQSYWRIGTSIEGQSEWSRMRSGGFAGIGWEAVGDLSQIDAGSSGRQELRARIEQSYPGPPKSVTYAQQRLASFVLEARERDLIVAMDGLTVLGLGRVTGPYEFKAGDGPAAHRRPVEWLSTEKWQFPQPEGLQRAFLRLKTPANLVEIERRLLVPDQGMQGDQRSDRPPVEAKKPAPIAPAALTGALSRIESVLARKRQAVLYGPPGTGKTFWAERAARELAARAWFHVEAGHMTDAQKEELIRDGAIEMCSFHPAYGYEDFLEGYRPVSAGQGNLRFELREGVFKKLCARASLRPDRSFFLVIDEINRGDIPRIFGELLTVLEKEKRGRPITLPVSGQSFSVPDNVFVIGTMNTADRSIALLDAALRRRFGFIELLPDSSVLGTMAIDGLPLGPWLDELNRRVVAHLGREARHLQVGHSYLLIGDKPIRDLGRFIEALRDDIIPLLEEYCYEDFEALEKILGSALVSRSRQRLDTGLFEVTRQAELIPALLSSFNEITSTRQAVAAEAAAPLVEDEDDEVEDQNIDAREVE